MMTIKASKALQNIASIWHADELATPQGKVVLTGSAELNAQLPGGGWPVGAVVEILQAHSGLHQSHSEWRLLLPALTHLTRLTHLPHLTRTLSAPCGALVLVGAPHPPFGPGLAGQGLDPQRMLWINTAASASRLWATEQALRCADVSAVLAWLPQVRADQLRRLQIAAAGHTKLLFVMRPASAQNESSPAVLRLMVSIQTDNDALWLHIFKRRGPPLDQPLSLPTRPARLAALLAVCDGAAGDAGAALQGEGEGASEASNESFTPRKSGHALDRIAAAA